MTISPRQSFVLAVLSSMEEGADFTPVQIQKLFFLIDREAATETDGPHFRFGPYDYGPFDRAVYDDLDVLHGLGLVAIRAGRYRGYALTTDGWIVGSREFQKFPEHIRRFITACARWVRALRFDELVAAIYNKYPDMKANSVFQG